MTLCGRVHMRAFAGATEWLEAESLGPAELAFRSRRELADALPRCDLELAPA